MDWNSVTREQALDNIELLRSGMPVSIEALYVLPTRASLVHENFVQRLEAKKWGFLLVAGENRAGKSVYIKHLHRIAAKRDYCIAHFEINEDLIKGLGPSQFLNSQLFEKLRFPDGETLLHRLIDKADFRQKIHRLIEQKVTDFELQSPAFASALSWFTQEQDEKKHKLANSWLRGESLYLNDLREIDVFDRTAKSLLNVPTDKVIYFLRELLTNLNFPGFLITVDEIERVGTLQVNKGRETLFWLRNLINALVSEESQAGRRGILDGIFLCFAISSYYLGFSGVVDVDPVAFKARVDREGRPKVMITDVPRLANLLKSSATMVDVQLEHADLVNVAERIQHCYNRAYDLNLSMPQKQLADEAFRRTKTTVAGPNVQQVVAILDSQRSKK